jgi:hypothetical protein
MLVFDPFTDSSNVGCRITSCEGDPKEIVQRLGREFRVIDNYYACDPLPCAIGSGYLLEALQQRLDRSITDPDSKHTRHAEVSGTCDLLDRTKIRQLFREFSSRRAPRCDHHLGTSIQGIAGIIQRVDGGPGLKVKT